MLAKALAHPDISTFSFAWLLQANELVDIFCINALTCLTNLLPQFLFPVDLSHLFELHRHESLQV